MRKQQEVQWGRINSTWLSVAVNALKKKRDETTGSNVKL